MIGETSSEVIGTRMPCTFNTSLPGFLRHDAVEFAMAPDLADLQGYRQR